MNSVLLIWLQKIGHKKDIASMKIKPFEGLIAMFRRKSNRKAEGC